MYSTYIRVYIISSPLHPVNKIPLNHNAYPSSAPSQPKWQKFRPNLPSSHCSLGLTAAKRCQVGCLPGLYGVINPGR